MPPKNDMALLFHPKKKKQGAQTPVAKPAGGTPDPKRRPPPPPTKAQDDDEDLKLPDEPFQEYRLLSSALNGWKYDVMKFESRKPVDIFRWTPPIKLNRKDIRKDDGSAVVEAPVAVGPMLGPDQKPVIGADGKFVMVDADGRPIRSDGGNNNNSSSSNLPGGSKDKGKAAAAKKRFQKKTRQVFFVPDEVRQLRKEERYPWVFEDSSLNKNEVWIGQMEDVSRSETHAFFMPAANDIFKFVPAHRWYKFHKRLKHDLPTDTVTVESLYSQNQKRDPQHWLANRTGRGVSSATAALFKVDSEGPDAGGSLNQSLAPGGRKLKMVDSGSAGLFDDEDDPDAKRRRDRDMGGEGDLDEQIFEEEFADDDEKMEVDADDEEQKEAEERLKKEYKSANKQRDAGVDESDDDDQPVTSKQAKAMQKLIRNREGNDAYDSDEDENPYASEVEEEEEEEEPVLGTAAAAIEEQQKQIEARSQTPKPALPKPAVAPSLPPNGSRAASPNHLPTHGGHSIVAQRATSPKIPKPKPVNASRGNSPLVGSPKSLPGSRATSPLADGTANGSGKNKRKAEDSPPATPINGTAPSAGAALPKPKKRKGAIEVSSAELEALLIEWLGTTTNASTRECIQHFTPYLADPARKAEFSGIVKKVATLKNGTLYLKSRASPSAPSPAAASM